MFPILILALLLYSAAIYPQLSNSESACNYIFGNMIGGDKDVDMTARLSDLDYRSKNPININTAALGELLTLPFINFDLAARIINRRTLSGPYVTDSDLYDTLYFSPYECALLLPFVRTGFEIDSQPRVFTNTGKWKSEINVRDSFDPRLPRHTEYAGSGHSTAIKASYHQPGSFSFLLRFAKDAGEESNFDFLSAGFSAKNLWALSEVFIGDFSIDFGRGLLLSSYGQRNRGAMLITRLRSSGSGPHQYTGPAENCFLRGGAAKFEAAGIELCPFVSYQYLDGKISADEKRTISISFSGLHRTKSELAERNQIKIAEAGIAAALPLSGTSLSRILIYGCKFIPPLGNDIASGYTPGASVFFESCYKRYSFNSEIAYIDNGFSCQINAVADITISRSFGISARRYNISPLAFHAHSAAAYQGSTQENGLLFCYESRTANQSISAFLDFYDGQQQSAPDDTTGQKVKYARTEAGIRWRTNAWENSEFRAGLDFSTAQNDAAKADQQEDSHNLYKLLLGYKFIYREFFTLEWRTDFHFNASDNNPILSGLLFSVSAGCRLSRGYSVEGRLYGYSRGSLYHETEQENGGDFYYYSFSSEGYRYFIALKAEPLQNISIIVRAASSENGYTTSSLYKTNREISLKILLRN